MFRCQIFRNSAVLTISLSLIFSIDGTILRLKECNRFDADFSIILQNTKLNSHPIKIISDQTIAKCIQGCIVTGNCKSINFKYTSGECQLLSEVLNERKDNIVREAEWTHYATDPDNRELGEICEEKSPCPFDRCEDICNHPGYKCICLSKNYTGEHCDVLKGNGGVESNPAVSCKELSASVLTLRSGYYWIQHLGTGAVNLTFCKGNVSRKENGKTPSTASGSCQQLKNDYPNVASGFFWIYSPSPTKVYCDMETDGGGWLMIGHVDSRTASNPNDLQFENIQYDNVVSLETILQQAYLLSKTGLRRLHEMFGFQQIRIYCTKDWHSRVFHMATNLNDTGLAMTLYGTELSSVRPSYCGSFYRLPHDTSILSTICNKWRFNVERISRLYNHFIYTSVSNHVHLLKNNRLECDDYADNSGFSSKGVWKYFVR